jgi:hypothetical protein
MSLTPEEKRAYKRAWLKAHPGYNRAYHEAHKPRIKALNKAWREANPKKIRAISQAWETNNPDKRAFYKQRWHAKRRGIPFLLTLEEWVMLWKDSGKWELRGRSKGQYVMARVGDQGPYAVGNVYICTTSENISDRWK